MEQKDKKLMLLNALVRWSVSNLFDKKLTRTELKQLYNLFIMDTLESVADRLCVAEKNS